MKGTEDRTSLKLDCAGKWASLFMESLYNSLIQQNHVNFSPKDHAQLWKLFYETQFHSYLIIAMLWNTPNKF